jgi:hypothetical protein
MSADEARFSTWGGRRDGAGNHKLSEAQWFFVVEAYGQIYARLQAREILSAEGKSAFLQEIRELDACQPKQRADEELEDFAARRRAWRQTAAAKQLAVERRQALKSAKRIPHDQPDPFCGNDEDEAPLIGEFGVIVWQSKQLKGWHPRIEKILQFYVKAKWDVSVSTHSIKSHWKKRDD